MSEKESKIKLLFREIQEGNKDAFNELFDGYYGRLVIFAKQYCKQQETAEEITSELFVKLWLKRNTLATILYPEVYLYTSVKNAGLNLIRSSKKRTVLSLDEEASVPLEMDATNFSNLEDKELERLMDAAVASLPPQRKIIFRLIKEDGLKTSQVSVILGISKRTVENQLYKAVKSLAETISVYLGYHPQHQGARKKLQDISIIFLMCQ